MKIANIRVLFYAIDPTSDRHEHAARWLEEAINDPEPLTLTWPALQQFLRLGTNPAFPGYMTDEEAMAWAEEWIEAGVEILGDTDLRWDL